MKYSIHTHTCTSLSPCRRFSNIFSQSRGTLVSPEFHLLRPQKRRKWTNNVIIYAKLAQYSSNDLKQLDSMLAKNVTEGEAVAYATSLRDSGALRAFGAALKTGVPKRSYTLEELRLNKIQTDQFLAPKDTTLSQVRTAMQVSYLAGLTAAFLSGFIDFSQLAQIGIISAFILTIDQVGNAGGVEALLVDTAGRFLNPSYANRVALHESGHFLIAYLLGLLPKGYTLSSLSAYLQQRVLNVQAGTTFCDSAFQKEIASGTLSSSSLDVYSCVALAGVATEWLRFGVAEGGLSDITQLDRLLRALGFSQAKADDQVRWSVLNVVTLLRRHSKVQDLLAEAMARQASIGECIDIIEGNIDIDAV